MISSYATTSSAVVLSSLQTFVATTSHNTAYRAVLDQVYLIIPLVFGFTILYMFVRKSHE